MGKNNIGSNSKIKFGRTWAALPVALCLASSLTGCFVVDTTAGVVKAGASVVGTVVGTTAKVAGAVVTTGVAVATAGVVVVGTAKNVAIGTVSLGIAAVSLIGNAVVWGVQFSRPSGVGSNDELYTSVTSLGQGDFQSHEGRVFHASSCADAPVRQAAVLAITRAGLTEVRLPSRSACVVETVTSQ